MRAFDLSPLFRSGAGLDRFDRLFDTTLGNTGQGQHFPAYDIVKRDDDTYRITLAVPGYNEDDINVTQQGRTLTIAGKSITEESEGDDKPVALHRGISRSVFTHSFRLDESVRVQGAALDNGLLNIDLVSEIPEAEKPRAITINRGETAQANAA